MGNLKNRRKKEIFMPQFRETNIYQSSYCLYILLFWFFFAKRKKFRLPEFKLQVTVGKV